MLCDGSERDFEKLEGFKEVSCMHLLRVLHLPQCSKHTKRRATPPGRIGGKDAGVCFVRAYAAVPRRAVEERPRVKIN